MVAELEIVMLEDDVATVSTDAPAACCDWGCYDDTFQTSADNHDD